MDNWAGSKEAQQKLYQASSLLSQAESLIAQAKQLTENALSDMDSENTGRDLFSHTDDIGCMSEWSAQDDISTLVRHLDSVASSVVEYDPADEEEEEDDEEGE